MVMNKKINTFFFSIVHILFQHRTPFDTGNRIIPPVHFRDYPSLVREKPDGSKKRNDPGACECSMERGR